MGYGTRSIVNLGHYPLFSSFLVIAALSGCGGGSGTSGGGSGGGGTPPPAPPFQARPFPGDFYAVPPSPEFGSLLAGFPANVIYDSGLKEFLFSDNARNEVEAYSAVDGHRVGAVTVPGAMGLSLSPDGTRLAVGTSTPRIYFVDPAALHVTRVVEVPASVMDPAKGLEPAFPFLMAAGPMLIETAAPTAPLFNGGNLLSYDPASGIFAPAHPPGAVIDIIGAVPARSLDGNYLAVPMLGPSNFQVAVYSAQSQTYIGSTPPVYSISGVAVNPDGSQFAVVSIQAFGMTQTATFFDRSLVQQFAYPTQNSSIVYSRDGTHLYIREMTDVFAVAAQTGATGGYQGLALPGPYEGTVWDTDERNRVYGIGLDGAFVASLTQLQSVAPQMPLFEIIDGMIGFPNEGQLSGGTPVQFAPSLPPAGKPDGIGSDAEAYFGATAATKDVVAGLNSTGGPFNALTATAPAAAAGGPVSVLITDAQNNAVLLPDYFSYGPQVHWVDPSAISPSGGTVSYVWADGLQAQYANHPGVTIGGAAAAPSTPNILPVPIRQFWFTAPAGTPGWADFKLSVQDGTSDTAKNMVQYLAQDVTLTSPAYTSAVYDSKRDKFYLAGADNTVGVFDPESQTLLRPIQSSAVSPGAVLNSLALTPDNAKLLASDPADHSLVVFDLAANTSTAINVLVASDGPGATLGEMPVAALKGDQALVLLTGFSKNELRQIDLTQMTVRVRTDVQNAGTFSVAPLSMVASSDGSTALLGASEAADNKPFYAWRYDAAADSFSAPVTISYGGYQTAINSDGTVLGMGAFSLDQDLLPMVPFPDPGYHVLMPGTGALRFSADKEVLIVDTRSGKPLVTVGSVSPADIAAFAVDPSGQKILAVGGTTLNYSKLAVVPLAVATVSPASAPPGAALTIRGTGFVAGTTATIAQKSASCTLVDAQTLQCAVPALSAGLAPMTFSNPDGQTYSLEAAVNVE